MTDLPPIVRPAAPRAPGFAIPAPTGGPVDPYLDSTRARISASRDDDADYAVISIRFAGTPLHQVPDVIGTFATSLDLSGLVDSMTWRTALDVARRALASGYAQATI